VVAVVLGGHSAFQRDAHMRELIGAHIKEASLQRTAPAIAERAAPEPQQAAVTKTVVASRADPTPTATAHVAAGSNDPIQPLLVRTVSYRIAPVQPAPLAPMPALVAAPAPQPEPARVVVASADTVPPVTMPVTIPVTIPAAKSDPIKPEAAKPAIVKPEVATAAPASAEPVIKAESVKAEPIKAEPPAQIRARGGWVIQIGAFPGEDEAKQHLSAARSKVRDRLAAADPFTERVLKGDKALYRARFAGFDKATADATCKQLKRNDFDCITVKN
jgi:D-alanyl-D-alanine carboxypeptidase